MTDEIGRYKKLGTQYACGCVKYADGTIVRCNEHETVDKKVDE